jgi:hypothetical protein
VANRCRSEHRTVLLYGRPGRRRLEPGIAPRATRPSTAAGGRGHSVS